MIGSMVFILFEVEVQRSDADEMSNKKEISAH